MKEHYYLDNAATTWPKPEAVYTTMDRFFRDYGVNPGRGGHELAVEAEKMVTQTRRLLAEFFNYGGDPSRVVFTQNATDSLNMALYGLLGAGDHVVTTRLEHNSVLRPLNHLERDHGVRVTYVGRDSQGYVDPEDVRRALTPETKLIVINHASNVLGSVQDLSAIGKIARTADVLLIVDSCQSAGVLPIDADGVGIGVLVFTGHKGLFGPMGIGGMIVREGVDIQPSRVGGTGVDSLAPFQPDKYPYHLEAGTLCLPGIAGINAAQKWFAELGRQHAGTTPQPLSHTEACRVAQRHIEERERSHVQRLAAAFNDLEGVTVYGPSANQPRVATLSINIDGVSAEQVGAMLDADYHVCVRTGLHCAPLVHQDESTVEQKGTVRFSPGYFTEDDDIDQVIEGVSELVGLLVRA
jgi:cysteine desulfurase/selenocysteine lyase